MISQTKKAATTKKRQQRTKAPTLLAILMAMRIRRHNAKHITQYRRTRATLDATGSRDQASICPVSSRRTPWSSILALKIQLCRCGNRFLELAFKRHKMDPLLSSSKQQDLV
jgi:hypothetical protein